MEIESKLYLSISLKNSGNLLEKFGGHKQAAGFTINKNNIEAFKESINQYAETKNIKDLFEKTAVYDLEVDVNRINPEFVNAITKLGPFGVGNPEPIIRLNDLQVENPKLIGKNHDSTSFYSNGFNVVCFNDVEIFKSGIKSLSILTNLRKTCYNRNNIQFLVKDYKLNFTDNPSAINYKLRNSNAYEITEMISEYSHLEKLDRPLLVDIYKIAKLSKDRGVYIRQLLKRYNIRLFDLCYILNIFKELKLLDFEFNNDLIKFKALDNKAQLEDSKLLQLFKKEKYEFSGKD